MRSLVALLSAPLGLLLGLLGCGAETPSSRTPARQAPASSSTSSSSPPSTPLAAPTGSALRRSDLDGVLAQGLGSFLQRVELDGRPVLAKGGAFRGFRIAALHGDAFWHGVDLKPGDVVTSVNGFPIERPEQAQVAFDSLQVSSELRVAYERNGSPRELVYTIVAGR